MIGSPGFGLGRLPNHHSLSGGPFRLLVPVLGDVGNTEDADEDRRSDRDPAWSHLVFLHRARAAFRASALRSSSLIAAKRAFAPRPAAALPPSRPSATAARFFFGFAMRRIL